MKFDPVRHMESMVPFNELFSFLLFIMLMVIFKMCSPIVVALIETNGRLEADTAPMLIKCRLVMVISNEVKLFISAEDSAS